MPTAPPRPNLSQTLLDTVRDRVVRGALPASGRINEVALAEELGVSRTPLREALVGLAAEKLVVVEPRRGFFVAPLEANEVRDLYEMRAILDPAALRAAGIPSERQMKALRTLMERMRGGGAAARLVDLDNRWHRTLVEHCPNRILLDQIDHFVALTRRYEHRYFRETSSVEIARAQHERILDALARGQLDAACRALRENMRSAIEPLRAWLEGRRSS